MKTHRSTMLLAVLFAAMALACDDEESTPVAPAAADLAAAPTNGPVLNTVGNDGYVIDMCYMPTSGNVYRINETDLKQGCRSPKDVEFSFNVQGPQGVKGDKGDKGDPGPQGPPGLSGYQQVTSASPIPPNLGTGSVFSATAQCPSGKKALGGGLRLTGQVSVLADLRIFSSQPASLTSWRAEAIWVGQPPSPAAASVTLTAFAVCAFAT